MKDFISLGTVPCNENTCQVGRPNYDKYGKLEASEYKRMIEDTMLKITFLTIRSKRWGNTQ